MVCIFDSCLIVPSQIALKVLLLFPSSIEKKYSNYYHSTLLSLCIGGHSTSFDDLSDHSTPVSYAVFSDQSIVDVDIDTSIESKISLCALLFFHRARRIFTSAAIVNACRTPIVRPSLSSVVKA